MLKINIVEDWAPINRVPATAKDIIIVIAAASGAVCLLTCCFSARHSGTENCGEKNETPERCKFDRSRIDF